MKHIKYKTKIKDIDEKGIVTVAANAFGNVDSDGDISMEGSYTKTISENFNRVKWLLNHTSTLIGVPLEAKEEYPHLKVIGQLNLDKEIGRDVYSDYKLYAEYGRTLEHSVGVEAIKRDEQDDRRVLEWKWWEYSTLTTWGANDNTPMLGLKNLNNDDDILKEVQFLEKALRQNYTDERLEQIETTLNRLKSLIKEPSIDTLVKPELIKEWKLLI